MEPYVAGFKHVQRDYGVHLKLANDETHTVRNTQHSKPGSYGVSIRVQGIDGHPYIVLNNTEGCLSENPSLSENGLQVASQTINRSAPNSNTALKLGEKNSEEIKFPGTQSTQPSMFKSLKQTNINEGENGVSDSKYGTLKPSNLLNFQRHPELLQPYDPEKNNLNLDSYQSSVCNKSKSLEFEGKIETKPWTSSSKVVTLQKNPQLVESAKSNVKTIHLNKSIAVEDQNKHVSKCPSVTSSPNEMHVFESLSSSGGSPHVSPTGQPETRKSRPDVLSFGRQNSAGPVLDGSRRSSSSSTTPTSANSLYKFLLDDQEYAIYADNVNRHENRRYIPFLPGTGRDIDTGSIPAVDQLIEKFDRKIGPQRRGRSGKRNRIHPDDHKRSRSVDSVLSLGLEVNSDYLDEFSKNLGKSTEHLLRPSKICLQKQLSLEQKLPSPDTQVAARTVGKLQPTTQDIQNSHYNSLQYQKENKVNGASLMFKSSTLPVQNKKEEVKTVISTLLLPNRITIPPDPGAKKILVKTFSSTPNTQATPDLLKGQQDLAQQTNEETAKQILYNYLKEGSTDNDDATKRKVNLVFEKIQTLKSRAAGSAQVSNSSIEIKALMEQKTELESKVAELQKKLDLEIRNQQNAKEERDTTRATLKDLQQQLDKSVQENDSLKKRLGESEKELRQNLEELFQVKMEREQHQTEIRDLEDQLSEMHDELDNAKHAVDGEKEVLIEELMQMKQNLQEIFMTKEQQEEILRKRERELTALKGALKEEVSNHDLEIDKLKEQHDKELQNLREALEEATKNAAALASERNTVEQMQSSAENRVKELAEQNEQLKRTIKELEDKIKELHQQIDNMKGKEDTMKEKIERYEKEKQHLEDVLAHAGEEGKELLLVKKSLESELEHMQKKFIQVIQEQQQLTEQLKDETNQKEQLKRTKNEMENERWQLDKTIEKLHKEMRRMEEDLRGNQRAQDEAMTKTQLLEQTVKGLEYELEAKNHLKSDRARQMKLMEDKMSQLELELDEERNNSDLLSERISRCREQIEQMRNELLQERATRQDLECDKISLERQNKDLKSRILHLEGSYRSSKEGLVAQMEARITELEERLENEERDRANLQLSNRRLERKVKELMLEVDDEHLSLTDQKDQLSLRLKAMKRQVEEAEEEIDRLESAKKKLQRELEEQMDMNDQLQGQLNAIKKELSRRKKSPSKVLTDLDDDDDEDDYDDDFSTDGESLYEAPSGHKSSKDNDTKS
ncbi:cingulin-like protein 1 isoform X4 [Dermochelys coriacea]|uniref:cingulin-like protein 1 isoform X4 n=1 Tax=Dermochelys coriacea TaxID=27794 RepID=UPI0018E7E2C5|nr:cingulin-like protein 1 isoform X4 [Dermochelys coriacea]